MLRRRSRIYHRGRGRTRRRLPESRRSGTSYSRGGAEAHQWIHDLLDEVEKERELKLGAEERSVALQWRVNLDVEAVAWLRRE